MVAVEQMIKDGKRLADPNVGSWFSRMAALQAALMSITKKTLPNHVKWSEWWKAAEKEYKLPD